MALNKKEYIYANAWILHNDGNTPLILGNDGYLYKNGSKASNIGNIKHFATNWLGMIAVTNDGKVYTGGTNVGALTYVSQLSNVIWASAGNSSPTYMAITKDHKLYGWGRNAYGILGLGHTNTVSSPTLLTLPNNEIPFMSSIFDDQSAVLTMAGNVYFAGYDAYYTSTASKNTYTFTKINISNVTFVNGNDGDGGRVGLYMIKEDGTAYVVGSSSYKGPTPYKINISNAHVIWGTNNANCIIVTNDNIAYQVYGTSVTKMNTTSTSVCAVPNGGTVYTVVDTSGKVSTVSSATATPSYNSTYSSNVKQVIEEIGDYTIGDIKGTYIATNKLTYYYRVRFEASANNIYIINYIAEYGLSDSYGSSYSNNSVTFTQSTAVNHSSILTEKANTEINNLKKYLDSLIGTIDIPTMKTQTHTAANGLVYTIKVIYSKSISDTTSYTMSYETLYGINSNPNIQYTDKKHIIIASNYSTYKTDLSNLGNDEIQRAKDYLNTIIGELNIPSTIYKNVTLKNNNIYKIKSTFSLANKTNNYATINFSISYGIDDNYGNLWSSNSYTVLPENYSSHYQDLTNIANEIITECYTFLDSVKKEKIYIKSNSEILDIMLLNQNLFEDNNIKLILNDEEIFLKVNNSNTDDTKRLKLRKNNDTYTIEQHF